MSSCSICEGRLRQERVFSAQAESECMRCLGLFSSLGTQFTAELAASGFTEIFDVSLCVKLCPSLTLRSIIESRISPVTDFKETVKIILNGLIDLEISSSNLPLPGLKIDIDLVLSPPSPLLRRLRSAREVNEAMLRSSDLEICTLLGISDLSEGLRSEAKIIPKITINRESLFLLGKYKKFSRDISQSLWFVDVEYVPLGSVEELALEFVRTNFQVVEPLSAKFSASGREDVDVRMLGTGRDFVLEISSLKSLKYFQVTKIPDFCHPLGVEISRLRVVDRRVSQWLQICAENHEKNYECVVWSKKPVTREILEEISRSKNLTLNQWTPVRTLHRRPNMERQKMVISMHAEFLSGNFFKLKLSTTAGTYVKEFVHGDFGRTQPCLADLLGPGNSCDILQLDVLGVEDQDYD